MFQRMKPVVKAMLRPFADALVVSSQALPGRIDDQITKSQAFMQNPRIAAKFYAYEEDSKSYLTLEPEVPSETGGLPVPPRELWEGYGSTVETYLGSGRKDVQKMEEILVKAGFSFRPENRILDFGCAAGRMIRHLEAISTGCEVWGVDVSAKHISWCRQNLSPPFYFVSSTTFPYLPFEDHYFDFIYAGSVFTHIADLADAWFMELRRILRSKGKLYITVHDRHSIEMILKSNDRWLKDMLIEFEGRTHVMESRFEMFVISRTPKGAQVFYNIDYLRKNLERIFQVLSVTPEAYSFQTALLLEKPGQSSR